VRHSTEVGLLGQHSLTLMVSSLKTRSSNMHPASGKDSETLDERHKCIAIHSLTKIDVCKLLHASENL
jgi:hypothetical protein